MPDLTVHKRLRLAIADPGAFVTRGGLVRDEDGFIREDRTWPHDDLETLLDWQARAVAAAFGMDGAAEAPCLT